ncbi:hypothetical protein BV22DRAFT_1135820 [Leucogyrophana mollusca]|uniref:Uncharacterized protein n=1 Tax=Leucogyrophana mollusca TaxID=85980 RepID=A0ACB8AUP7_9AGAM|nr:hypothetical protein BV22DRAFT_1135820 [Leucogyrophana mollusca]
MPVGTGQRGPDTMYPQSSSPTDPADPLGSESQPQSLADMSTVTGIQTILTLIAAEILMPRIAVLMVSMTASAILTMAPTTRTSLQTKVSNEDSHSPSTITYDPYRILAGRCLQYLPNALAASLIDTHKSDVWSLGETFFETLVRRTPFEYEEGEWFARKADLEKYWVRTMRGKWVGEYDPTSFAKNLERENVESNVQALPQRKDNVMEERRGKDSVSDRTREWKRELEREREETDCESKASDDLDLEQGGGVLGEGGGVLGEGSYHVHESTISNAPRVDSE